MEMDGAKPLGGTRGGGATRATPRTSGALAAGALASKFMLAALLPTWLPSYAGGAAAFARIDG